MTHKLEQQLDTISTNVEILAAILPTVLEILSEDPDGPEATRFAAAVAPPLHRFVTPELAERTTSDLLIGHRAN